MRAILKKLPSLPRLMAELYNNQREYFLFIVSLVVAGAIGTVALGFFLKILEDLYGQGLRQFDESAFEVIYSLRSQELNQVVTFITHMGGAPAYFILIPFIGLWLYYRGHNWKIPVQSTIILLTAFLLNIGLKYFIARPRPLVGQRLVEVYSYSFPSGHTMSAVAFYGFLIYLVFRYINSKRWKWILTGVLSGLTAAIGISRVYLGVHYATDVMAGFVVGLFWLMICIIAIRSIEFYRKRKKPSDPDANN